MHKTDKPDVVIDFNNAAIFSPSRSSAANRRRSSMLFHYDPNKSLHLSLKTGKVNSADSFIFMLGSIDPAYKNKKELSAQACRQLDLLQHSHV
jgi:hypothetical protein